MGTQQSSRSAAGLPIRQSPSSKSALRELGLDDAEVLFASPPKVWLSSSPASGAASRHESSWHVSSSINSSPRPDLEAGATSPAHSELESPGMIIDPGRDSPDTMSEEGVPTPAAKTPRPMASRSHIAAIPDQSSKMTVSASCESLATTAESFKPSLGSTSDSFKPSLARGSSTSRPRWSRPRPSTAGGSASSSRPSTSGGLKYDANGVTPFDPHQLASELEVLERMAKLSLREGDDPALAGKVHDVQPPSTPSTISDSGLSRTRSSFSSSSGWGSRPTTSSSTFSSSNFWGGGRDQVQQLVVPEEDQTDGLVDCSRGSRLLASGASTPNSENLKRMPSIRAAWASDAVEDT